ncbi:MAG: 50S ribosomal protein L29 [Flavobacteriales bacterium]|nr:50S ribosomal protein L29 [Flavobacteriales bacterium]
MKASELRDLTVNDLQEKLEMERATYHKMRFQHNVSSTENPSMLKVARRNVARILTELNARKLAEK